MSLDFVAIDFETANELRTSACALAVVVFQNGMSVLQHAWLIRPPEEANYFNYFNTLIHGIRKEDVQNERTFDQIWPEVYALIHGRTVVAHNASFDISVLRQLIVRFELDCPEIDIVCSCNVAKRTWATHHNHRLDTMG